MRPTSTCAGWCGKPSTCSTRRGARGRGGRRRRVVVHEWLKQAILLLFRSRKMETIELGPFEYADKLPLKTDFAAAGVRVGARGIGPLRLVPRAGRHADAELREHRRPRRCQHDGRHLGDGRFVRPDRAQRAPVGRRRHRWRARAAAGRAGDHRGRLLHRQPLHRRRGRPGRAGRVLGAGVHPRPAPSR